MGYVMAGASQSVVITRDFLNGFDATYYDTGMSMGMIASLMRYGDWDKDTLKVIGDVAPCTGTPLTRSPGKATPPSTRSSTTAASPTRVATSCPTTR